MTPDERIQIISVVKHDLAKLILMGLGNSFPADVLRGIINYETRKIKEADGLTLFQVCLN